MSSPNPRAVFLDRDGVINRSPDNLYVRSWEDFLFIEGALEALHSLHVAGIPVFVISNQSGVGRGLMSHQSLLKIDELMHEAVRDAGGEIRRSYYCIHAPDEGCKCRKPEIGLLLQARQDFGFSLKEAVLIGDKGIDIETGEKAGCPSILVLSGNTQEQDLPLPDIHPIAICRDLKEAVEWLLRQGQ